MAIVPESGELYAPADGVIENIPDSLHAVTMTTDSGMEILLHVGLDTVALHGAPYHAQVHAGEHVKAGQLLLTFDLAAIRDAGYDPTTPVVVTNVENSVLDAMVGQIRAGDTILTLRSTDTKGAAE